MNDKEKHKYCGTKDCSCTLASHEKAKYWHPTKNGDITPGDVALGSTKKYWFTCSDCGHDIDQCANHISSGKWCRYCSNSWKFCGNDECQFCFKKSFASCDKAKYWDYTKNSLKPIEIAVKSDQRGYFKCDVCKHSFSSIVKNISRGLSWCPHCSVNPKHCKDISCEWCNDKSFKSNEKSKLWHPTKNGDTNICFVTASSKDKYWFLCDKCGHDFYSSPGMLKYGGCSYCSTSNWTHCGEKECEKCFKRSFASTDKAKYWHPTKNGNTNILYLAKAARSSYWFLCGECNHSFELAIYNIHAGNWCKYCSTSNWKHCGEKECQWCFKRSFASHPKSVYIVDKSIELFKYAKYTHKKLEFKCNDCQSVFSAALANVSAGKWCPNCKYKTEKKLHKWLLEKYNVKRDAKFDWCKNEKTNLHFPFDFYLPDKNVIIELDGDHHFKQVLIWKPCDYVQDRDIFKMQKAVQNGIKIIRLYQENVYRDRGQWESKLDSLISDQNGKKLNCIFTKKEIVNTVYTKYENIINKVD